MNLARFFISFCLLFSFIAPASGHVIDAVEFEFQADAKEWRLLGEMDIAFMLPEMRVDKLGPPLSRREALKASPETFARYRTETEATLRRMLRLSYGGKDVPWRITFPDFEKQPFDLPPEAGDVALLSVKIVADALPGPGELVAHWTDDLESEFFAVFDEAGAPVVTAAAGRSTVLLKVSKSETPEAADVVETPKTRLSEWVYSGFHHVLPLGLDHLLFIIGLFLLVPKWKPLLGQSLLFTVAHSITLGLAVFGLVPQWGWVEIAIAASIAFIGIENLFAKNLGVRRLVVVFAFGLIHGLGFASVLGEKLENVPRESLAVPLVGFNLGVELAQITVLAICFLVLWPLRKWTSQVQVGGSVIVALAGLGWMIERIFFSA